MDQRNQDRSLVALVVPGVAGALLDHAVSLLEFYTLLIKHHHDLTFHHVVEVDRSRGMEPVFVDAGERRMLAELGGLGVRDQRNEEPAEAALDTGPGPFGRKLRVDGADPFWYLARVVIPACLKSETGSSSLDTTQDRPCSFTPVT